MPWTPLSPPLAETGALSSYAAITPKTSTLESVLEQARAATW